MLKAGKKILYAVVGILATVLGIIGIWVPGLPTTVFILIALWAFSQSSARLHAWLTKLPLLRHAIQEAERFQREGTVDFKAKIISQCCAWTSFFAVAIFSRNLVASIIVFALALSCSIFMWRVPTSQSIIEEE